MFSAVVMALLPLLVPATQEKPAATPAATPPAARALTPIPLPHLRHGHRVEVIGAGLLCFGGFGDASVPDREARHTYWLAPGATQWERRADMLMERAFASSAVVDGKAFAIGEGVERYDLELDRWTAVVPPGELPKSHFGAAAIERELFVLGGYGGKEPALYVVDVDKARVRAEPPPPSFKKGDHFHILHELRGELHVLGGLDGESFQQQSKHWVRTREGWKARADLPAAMWSKFAAHGVADGKLHIWGEFGAWRFDPESNKWSELEKLGVVLAMPDTFSHAGDLWILGGMAVGTPDARFLRRYSLATGAWSNLDPH